MHERRHDILLNIHYVRQNIKFSSKSNILINENVPCPDLYIQTQYN